MKIRYKNSLIAVVLLSIFSVTPALANDIYIEQVGDTLDLDIIHISNNQNLFLIIKSIFNI